MIALGKIAGLALMAGALTVPAAVCAQNNEPEEQVDPRAQDSSWHAQQQLYLLDLKTSDGWHYMEGGLRWRWLEYRASQTKPTPADNITIHYEGKLIDGSIFDSSYERGEPATFPLGRLIPGWIMAIPQMGVGETIEIAIPSSLAYGPEGRGPIPANATLLFKVELIAIEN